MTSEELFNEASRLFPEAYHIYASVGTQRERKNSPTFTTYTIGVGTTSTPTTFDIAYGFAYDAETCIANAVADADTKRPTPPCRLVEP